MFDQGKIAQWNDERVFGFITPDDGSPRVFAHISAFRLRHPLPEVGADGKFTFTGEGDSPRFWKVEGEDGVVPQ